MKIKRTIRGTKRCARKSLSTEGAPLPPGFIIALIRKPRLRRLHYVGRCGLVQARDYADYHCLGTLISVPHVFIPFCIPFFFIPFFHLFSIIFLPFSILFFSIIFPSCFPSLFHYFSIISPSFLSLSPLFISLSLLFISLSSSLSSSFSSLYRSAQNHSQARTPAWLCNAFFLLRSCLRARRWRLSVDAASLLDTLFSSQPTCP